MRDLCFDSKVWKPSHGHLPKTGTPIIKHSPTEQIQPLIVNSKKRTLLHYEWPQEPPLDAFPYFKQFKDHLNATNTEKPHLKQNCRVEQHLRSFRQISNLLKIISISSHLFSNSRTSQEMLGIKKALISSASFVNLLLIWTHFQQIGRIGQILGSFWFIVCEKLVRVDSDAGGWSRESSLCLCFASAAHVQSLDLHHTGPRSRNEGFAFLISTCLRETRNSHLVTMCAFSVHQYISVCKWWLQTHHTSYHWSLLSCWQNGRRCWFFLFSLRHGFIHVSFRGLCVLSLGYDTWWFILKAQRGESPGAEACEPTSNIVASLKSEEDDVKMQDIRSWVVTSPGTLQDGPIREVWAAYLAVLVVQQRS